jgi:hypothetical protein
MRTTRLVVAAAGLTLGLAACTSGGSTTAGPSPSTSGSATADTGGTQGSLAGSCVVGNWKSTSFTLQVNSPAGASGNATGGSGVLVSITRDGATVVDFAGMQPVNFEASISNAQIKGQFKYGGNVKGAVQVASTAAKSGTWKPVGPVDWSSATITLDMSSPIQGRIADNLKISDFANSNGAQTNGTVDPQPFLHEATYECSGDTLKIGPAPGSAVGGTWILTRT